MLDQKTIDKIVTLAAASGLARVNWSGRGRAPIGYIKGMAVIFGKDVFDNYENQLRAIGMVTDGGSEVDRLRALFVVLTGLGMRESSGRYCEGRDRSASNTTAETAEAGAWQMSWDGRRASPEIAKLLHEPANKQTFLDIFREGVQPREGDLNNYGDGDGLAFQAMCKLSPAFAAQTAAIGLRTLYTHWGPIIRHEVDVRPEANVLFQQVQDIVGVKSTGTAGKPAQPSTGWLSALVAAVMAMFRRAPTKQPEPSAPVKPAAGQTPWMPWAAKEVGFHESGTNRNIGRYTGPAKCGSEGDPWCAIFVNAGLESNGIRGSRSAMARSFERQPENFARLSGPAFGAITTMWRGSPSSGLGHVFFYLGHLDNNRVLALGGNQSDKVCRQAEPANRIVGYWWPKSVPLPKVGKIAVDDDGSEEGSET